LQAPVNCGADAVEHMSINPTTAESQGITAATNAHIAMLNFGFGTYDTIWLDIEPYSYTNSSCKAAVNAYVDGWDSYLNG
jgi:hypothetical protein